MSKNDEKLPCFALGDQKVFLVSYEKYGTLVLIVMIIFSEFGGLCQHMQEGCRPQHSFSVLLPIFTQSLWCEYISYHFNCKNFELCLYVSIWKPLLVYFNQCLGAVHSNCCLKFIFFMFFALFCKTLMQKLWKIMPKRAFLGPY